MKKLLLSICSIGICMAANAQFTSPDSGVNWNLDSLVAHSNGAVIQNGTEFHIVENFILSENDTLEITTNEVIKVAFDSEIELLGVSLFTPADSLVITALDSTAFFPAIRLENDASIIANTILSYGGGIGIYDASPHIFQSTFMFNEDGTKGAINLFRSNAIIEECNFFDNSNSAISGGANIANAPQIINNTFLRNVTSNDNRAQISLGVSGTDTSLIKGNYIEGLHPMAGAIAFLSLGEAQTIIDSNVIDNNRYGIGMLSGGLSSIISNNIISNNNIQNDPDLGGSGINFAGPETNKSIVYNNEIFGNLWGITIQQSAKPNLGDIRPESYNEGMNKIYDNINSSRGQAQDFAIFNNTPDTIWAQNNDWGALDTAEVEELIFHNHDDSTLGVVIYLPLFEDPTGIDHIFESNSVLEIYPNPASQQVTINTHLLNESVVLGIYDISGRKIKEVNLLKNQRQMIDLNDVNSGIYFLKWQEGSIPYSHKLIISK